MNHSLTARSGSSGFTYVERCLQCQAAANLGVVVLVYEGAREGREHSPGSTTKSNNDGIKGPIFPHRLMEDSIRTNGQRVWGRSERSLVKSRIHEKIMQRGKGMGKEKTHGVHWRAMMPEKVYKLEVQSPEE